MGRDVSHTFFLMGSKVGEIESYRRVRCVQGRGEWRLGCSVCVGCLCLWGLRRCESGFVKGMRRPAL